MQCRARRKEKEEGKLDGADDRQVGSDVARPGSSRPWMLTTTQQRFPTDLRRPMNTFEYVRTDYSMNRGASLPGSAALEPPQQQQGFGHHGPGPWPYAIVRHRVG